MFLMFLMVIPVNQVNQKFRLQIIKIKRTLPKMDRQAAQVLQFRIPKATGKVNINTADVESLMSLKGIGAVKANAVIAYRQQNGPFKSIEEIMNVKGIKKATFEKIKDSISVE